MTDVEKTPAPWPATSVTLSSFNESTTALIDSTTPYLWLPSSTCDRFALAFNLTWDETFGLYLFPDADSLERYRSSPDLSVAFTLSGTDSINATEDDLDDQGLVTVAISANAFIHNLRYPFAGIPSSNTTTIPYFPLRRVEDGGKIIIGRTFLQEAYLITNYETDTFSVHQATFPDDPFRNTAIKAIPTGATTPPGSNGLSQGQLAGVIVGASLGGMILIIMVWWMLRNMRDRRGRAETENAPKDTESFAQPASPKAETFGILSKISENFAWFKPKRGDARDKFTPSPFTIKGGGSSHEGLPALELDGRRVRSPQGAAQFNPGPGDDDMMAYEIARMGLDPLPIDLEYDEPLAVSMQGYTNDGRATDSMVSPRRPSTDLGLYNLFPTSPIPDDFSDGSNSPMSPYTDSRGEWTNNMTRHPSTQPLVTTQFAVRSNSALSSSSSDPHSALQSASPHRPPVPHSTTIQRVPIDTSNIVCLGPLPDNVQLPYQLPPPPQPAPPPAAAYFPYGEFPEAPPIPPSVNHRWNRVSTAETLGSNYTVEEEARGRIQGSDIVHIPHLPDRRYSWE